MQQVLCIDTIDQQAAFIEIFQNVDYFMLNVECKNARSMIHKEPSQYHCVKVVSITLNYANQ